MDDRRRAAAQVADALEGLLGGRRGLGGGNEAAAARTLVATGTVLGIGRRVLGGLPTGAAPGPGVGPAPGVDVGVGSRNLE